MIYIKVLGSGCPNCGKLATQPKRAAKSLSIETTLVKVTDPAEYSRYNLLLTPGLVINEKLVSAGRIPSKAEITTWLVNALETA